MSVKEIRFEKHEEYEQYYLPNNIYWTLEEEEALVANKIIELLTASDLRFDRAQYVMSALTDSLPRLAYLGKRP